MSNEYGKSESDVYHDMGDASRDKGDYESAIKYFTESIRLDSNNGSAFGGRGWTYFKAGDYEKALADMNEAIRLDPTRTVRKERLTEILKAMGKAEE